MGEQRASAKLDESLVVGAAAVEVPIRRRAIAGHGVQALVRVLLEQARLDRAAGRHTAGLVSGYRGSPLGGLDLELWRRQKLLTAHDIPSSPA